MGVVTGVSYEEQSGTSNKTITRIVTLANDPATIVVLLGKGDLIVGASESFLENENMREKCPNAVPVSETDFEKIVSLKPDAVFVYPYQKGTVNVEKLVHLGQNVIYIDGYIIDKIPEDVAYIGGIIGAEEEAEEYIEYYNGILKLIDTRVNSNQFLIAPSVYIEGMGKFKTNGKGSGANSLIELAHGKNIAGDLETWPTVSAEWVIVQDPDLFIKIAYPGALKNTTMESYYNEITHDSQYSLLNVVKGNHTYLLNHKIAYNPVGVVALVYLAKAIYPEQFEDIDPDVFLQEYSDKYVPISDDVVENSFYPKFWKQ